MKLICNLCSPIPKTTEIKFFIFYFYMTLLETLIEYALRSFMFKVSPMVLSLLLKNDVQVSCCDCVPCLYLCILAAA